MSEYSDMILRTLQHMVDIHHPSTSAPPQIFDAADDSERFDKVVDVLDHLLERAVSIPFFDPGRLLTLSLLC